jgi:hypothetical protein
MGPEEGLRSAGLVFEDKEHKHMFDPKTEKRETNLEKVT